MSKDRETNLEYSFDKGVNFKSRVITLAGDISLGAFRLIDAAMTEMESSSKAAITLRINSMGGNVSDCLAIIGRLKSSKCKIIVEGYGAIMSSAMGILSCGDVRKCSKYATGMSHESSYSLEGRHSDQVRELKQREKEEKLWCEMMESFTKKSADWWNSKHKQGDIYFTAEQLLEVGVVDEIF